MINSSKMIIKIKHNLKILVKCISKFGLLTGVFIYLKLTLFQGSKISLPEFKEPIYLRKNTTDINLFYEIILCNEYNVHYNETCENVIDAGANIGLYSIIMANKFPNARIICIEPDKENYDILLKNIHGYPNIAAENKGLWNECTDLKIYDKYNIGKWGMVVEKTNDPSQSSIVAIDIPYLIEKYEIEKIDVLKIDIESSEYELFDHSYESWLIKTKMLIIELHDSMKKGCSKNFINAISKTFENYSLNISGENIIINNLS